MHKKKKTILTIVGQSGAGKTELTKYLAEKYGIPFVVSYTTRKMREGEVDGVDHKFVDVKEMPGFEDMIAYTTFGGNHYWATHSQIGEGVTSYVIDEKGLLKMIDSYNQYRYVKVYVVRLDNDVDEERRKRDTDRIILPDKFYDISIVNDYDSVEDFLENASKEIIDYLKKNKYIN